MNFDKLMIYMLLAVALVGLILELIGYPTGEWSKALVG